jgi:hypothetical protein
MVRPVLLRNRGTIFALAGFVLLLNPFVVGFFDLGDPDDFTYKPVKVHFYANGTYDAPGEVHGLDDDIACFEPTSSRSCALERAIHARGGLYYDGPPDAFIDSEYEYVFVYGEGFFRPIAVEQPNETVRYALDPVPTTEALDDVSMPLERAPTGVRVAIEHGHYETSDELASANQLVRTEDGYYVVYAARSHRVSGSERLTVVAALQWILGALGALFVLRGQRVRVERN